MVTFHPRFLQLRDKTPLPSIKQDKQYKRFVCFVTQDELLVLDFKALVECWHVQITARYLSTS